jgi:hypothetical protein
MDQVQQSVHCLLSELCADMSCGARNLEQAAHEAHRAILEWRRLKDVNDELRQASANRERKL